MMSLLGEMLALGNYIMGSYLFFVDQVGNWHFWLFNLLSAIIMLMYANRYEKD